LDRVELTASRNTPAPLTDRPVFLYTVSSVSNTTTAVGASASTTCTVRTRHNADLQRVIDLVVDDRHVLRASTAIALATRIDYRTDPLVASALP
jgi:hypothetical protein